MYLLNAPVRVHSLGLAEAEYPAAASLCASVRPIVLLFGIATRLLCRQSGAGCRDCDFWAKFDMVFALLSLWQCRELLRSIQRGKTRR